MMHRLHSPAGRMGAGLLLLTIVACGADASGPQVAEDLAGAAEDSAGTDAASEGAGPETADGTQEGSVDETTEDPPDPSPPPAVETSAAFSIEDPAGYTYDTELTVRVDDISVNLADARPGEAIVRFELSGDILTRNTTPERNLPPSYLNEVQVAYTDADLVAVGITDPICGDRHQSTKMPDRIPVCVVGNLTGTAEGGGALPPIEVGGELRRSLAEIWVIAPHSMTVSEEEADALVAVVEAGRPPLLRVLPQATDWEWVSGCTNITFVHRESDNAVCDAPLPADASELLAFSGESEPDDDGLVFEEQLTLEAGQIISARLRHRYHSSALVLVDPAGEELASCSGGATGTISGGFIEQTCTEVVTVQTDGVHIVRGWSRGSRMGYDVSIVELGN